ncbi:hypothetical protein [Salibaculum sp.]|uniref:hypothetical protein n=1 Tax=Salibaculum sp. TaxID=2855480 RepID=UPI002B468646|nr:hypothetical protein [Salibaculum sp.]HKL70855.1 hypothetical protein [Salibaculum sp.]
MKNLLLGAVASVMATSAHAGMSWSYSPERPSVSSSGDANGALLVLLVVGAIMLMNGAGQGTSRSKSTMDSRESQDDDDILMKF